MMHTRQQEGQEEEGIIYSDLSPVSVPEATSLSQFVLDHAAQHGDKVALVSNSDIFISSPIYIRGVTTCLTDVCFVLDFSMLQHCTLSQYK